MSNIFQGLVELPVRRAIQVLRNKVADANRDLDGPVFFDQHPGRAVPFAFSKTYVVEETDPADLDPSAFLLPQGTNILTGRDATFYWCETNAFAFSQRNVTSLPNAGLFDPVLSGGGAVAVQNTQGPLALNNVSQNFTSICFDLDLYDRRRGRSLTNGRMPGQAFFRGSTGFRRWKQPMRWEPDTEVEPRVYITEAQGAENVTGNNRHFLTLVFKGFMVLQEVAGRETMNAGEDDGSR